MQKTPGVKAVVNRLVEKKDSTHKELDFRAELEKFIADCPMSHVEQFDNFPCFAPRQAVTRFISRYEIFKRILDVQGSVIECGVLYGGGLMTFAQLSAMLEPVNHQRKMIGFDTFAGFPSVHKIDRQGTSEHLKPGGYAANSFEFLEQAVRLYDANRFLGHVPKVELLRGDVKSTIPAYLKENPHLVVSLLYLDFDLYEPTKLALEHFLPRIPKGGIVAFDELNAKNWPGESVAVHEVVGFNKLRIQRFPFDSYLSYAVIE